jgi:zinc protease
VKRLLIAGLLVACASGKQETKAGAAPAQQTPASSAQQSASAQPAPAPPPAAAQPGPLQQPGQAGQPPAAPGAKPAENTPAAGGTSPAAQVAQPAPNAEPEPPLMPEQPFRDVRPAALAVQPHFEAPVPLQRKLKNGARVLIVENHSVPLIAIDVRFLHGVDADPPDKPGLAEFVADTVDEGTRTRPADKLAGEIEDLAAHLGAGAGLESTTVHLNCLTETLPRALELLADVVQNPAFRKEDVERVRTLRLTGLAQKASSIGALAGDEAAKVLFGPSHPWGQPSGGTPQSVASITPEDLIQFHAAHWVPNDAVISVSGDVKPAEIVALLDKQFAQWKARPVPRRALPKVPKLAQRRIDGLDKPNATQSQVWVVGRLFKASDRDAIPLRVANLTLGGLFTSRLMQNLREKHGYSYGVYSRLSLLKDSGTFVASGAIVAKNTADAVAEYEAELQKFAREGVTADELASAKEALIRSLPSALETNDAVAGAMGNLVSLGLPLDYYQTLPARIARVTAQDVKRVSAKWIKPADWPVVVVGPLEQARTALEKLGVGPVSVSPAPGAQMSAQPAGAK